MVALSGHPCTCGFIPPVVVDHLARAGVKGAKLTAHESKRAREKRASAVPTAESLTAAMAPGTARREVYDCKHTWSQRENLVRGEGDTATSDEASDDAYDLAGTVREYFKTVRGRDSMDDAGMDLILNVHYGIDYMNAFWDGDEMTFGDGDGQIFVGFSRSLDVVAHELSHGVTQFTAALDYYSQSGALNEHFSDVFGAAITQHSLGQDADQADWLIGDEIMGPDLYGEALRSMKAPGSAYDNDLMGQDPQPAHMRDYFSGPADNRGVHINSGIPNRAFYLASTEIGTDKAAMIWYAALLEMWPTTRFDDAVEVIVEAARLLTKDGKVPLGSTQTVRGAFRSVGLPS